jgi:hypothetical protein
MVLTSKRIFSWMCFNSIRRAFGGNKQFVRFAVFATFGRRFLCSELESVQCWIELVPRHRCDTEWLKRTVALQHWSDPQRPRDPERQMWLRVAWWFRSDPVIPEWWSWVLSRCWKNRVTRGFEVAPSDPEVPKRPWVTLYSLYWWMVEHFTSVISYCHWISLPKSSQP